MKSQPVDDYLSRICNIITRLLDAEGAAIFLLDVDGQFRMRAGTGCEADQVGRALYERGEGITGRIALGETIEIKSPDELRQYAGHKGKYAEGPCGSLIGLPLFLGGRVLGVVKAVNKSRTAGVGHFTEEDRSNLELLAQTIVDGLQSKEEVMRALGRLYVSVLMPYSKRYQRVYTEGIKPAGEKLGMRCEKVDERHFTGDILRHIYACIDKADIVIAEMTGNNPNVFYETGYAHARKKPTVLITQTENKVPFNLHGFKHVTYKEDQVEELGARLSSTLEAIRQDLLSEEPR